MKLKNRILCYLILSAANMTVPYLVGIFGVFLFNQAPEFVMLGVFIGGAIVQAMFFTKVLGTTLKRSLILGPIMFIGLLGLTF